MICPNSLMDVREFKVLQWIKYMVWREGPNWKHRFIGICLHYLHIKKDMNMLMRLKDVELSRTIFMP